MEKKPLSYREAGVDIDTADSAKRRMAKLMDAPGEGVLNAFGAFGSLFDGRFPDLQEPVLVLKMEEPGSKQLLALQHGRVESLCQDLVNHIVNDVAVMGARPLAMLDTIICGKLEEDVVVRIVEGLTRACRAQGFSLVGGETSEQPGVLPAGSYVLSAALVGVVERRRVIDGSRIAPGDAVIGVASSGPHTNGYTLIRKLLERQPELAASTVPGSDVTFLDAVLEPHRCYLQGIQAIAAHEGLHGLAHITGGGIRDNLRRVLPEGIEAVIDLGTLKSPGVFAAIRRAGEVPDDDMLRTFNMGVGLVAVAAAGAVDEIRAALREHGYESDVIGEVRSGERDVRFAGSLRWS